jgi:hypothetical protein
MDVHQAIRAAEQQLPGLAAKEGENDPRWQAMIQIGDFIESEPEAVWQFVERWRVDADADVRSAVATCLLEHLLETNFAAFFPRVEARFERTGCSQTRSNDVGSLANLGCRTMRRVLMNYRVLHRLGGLTGGCTDGGCGRGLQAAPDRSETE